MGLLTCAPLTAGRLPLRVRVFLADSFVVVSSVAGVASYTSHMGRICQVGAGSIGRGRLVVGGAAFADWLSQMRGLGTAWDVFAVLGADSFYGRGSNVSAHLIGFGRTCWDCASRSWNRRNARL